MTDTIHPSRDDEHLRLLVNGVRDFAVFMLDAHGSVATWNAGAERLEGYKAEEIVGSDFARLYPPEDVEAGKPRRALAIAERDGRYEDEAWRVRKDGSRFWARVVITALRDPAGKLVGYGKVTRDMTEQRRATEQFRLAIEAAPTGKILVDEGGNIVLVSAQVGRIFGYQREEMIGQRVEMLVPERFRARHRGFREDFMRDPKSRPMGAGRDLLGLRRDGTEVPIEIGLNQLEAPGGSFVLCSVVEIADRQYAEREREELLGQLRTFNSELERRVELRTVELRGTLREREVLLQEVQHRVKNNLQVISSLINMQARSLRDDASRVALEECRRRVHAMALIHERLYQSPDYARVPFSEYTRSLADSVFHATGVSPEGVSLELDIQDVALAVDKAIPCGLILNELISNALKHAFPDGRSGTIRVELARLGEGQLHLAVADDGVGLPPGTDVQTSPSLGLHLVRMLAGQLDARIDVEATRGTCFRVTIPVEG